MKPLTFKLIWLIWGTVIVLGFLSLYPLNTSAQNGNINKISGSASPAGVLGSIQFNNGSGGLGSSGNLTWNPTGNIFNTVYASTTAVSASSLCLLTDCRSSWASASGWTRSGGKIFPTTVADILTATTSSITGPTSQYVFQVSNTDVEGGGMQVLTDQNEYVYHTFAIGYKTSGIINSWIHNDGDANFSILGTGSTTIGTMPGTQFNKFNVAGGAAIGRTYAGLNNNDPDGLIVEGKACFGCSDLADTADYFTVNGASGLIGAVHTYSTLQVDGTSSFFNTITGTNENLSGKLGIGTTTPNWALQVAGTMPSVAISDSSAGVNNKHWLLTSMGGNLYIGSSTDRFATSSNAAVTINGTGSSAASIATTSTSFILNLGADPNTNNASTTISMGKLQFDGYDAGNTRRCVFWDSSGALTTIVGACR